MAAEATFDEKSADEKLSSFLADGNAAQTSEKPQEKEPLKDASSALNVDAEKKSEEETPPEVKAADAKTPEESKPEAKMPEEVKPSEQGNNSLEVVASKQHGLDVSQFGAPWEEVRKLQASQMCKKCQLPVDISMCVQKNKGEQKSMMICRGCNATTTMLSRHLGSWPISPYMALPQEAQVAFFQKCSQAATQHGRLQYQNLRGHLSAVLVEREIETTKVKFTSKELPLTVWLTKGYTEDQVKAGESSTHPTLGEVWSFPLKEKSKEFAVQRVEESLCRFEADARKKKQTATIQVKGVAKPLEAPSQSVPEEEGMDWMIQASPAKKQKTEEREDEQPTEESLEAKKLRVKNNNAIQKFGKKCLTLLKPQMEKCDQYLVDKGLLPGTTFASLEKAKEEMQQAVDECNKVAFKTIEDGEALELGFTKKVFEEGLKNVKSVLLATDKMLKIVRKQVQK